MTPRRKEVLDFVRELIAVGRIDATISEIARALDLGVSNAGRIIADLVEGGYLERTPGKARSLRLPGVPDLRMVPSDVLSAELARRGVSLASLDPRAPVARGHQKSCAADTCGAAVQRGHLMCRQHWFALPADLRQRVLRTNSARDRRGYERAVTEARDLIDSGAWRQRA